MGRHGNKQPAQTAPAEQAQPERPVDEHAALFPDDVEIEGGFDFDVEDLTEVEASLRAKRPNWSPRWVREERISTAQKQGWVLDPEQPDKKHDGYVLMWNHKKRLKARQAELDKRNRQAPLAKISQARREYGAAGVNSSELGSIPTNPQDLRGGG